MTHGHNGHNLNKLGRGHLDDAHTKYQIYMACGFRQEQFLIFHLENLFLACVDQNHLNNYQRGLYKDHSCQVWPKSS